MGENLFVGSHKFSNDRFDAGYIRTFYGLWYEHDLTKDDDFSVVEKRLRDVGFDFSKPIDIGLDGDVLVYGQR